MLSYFKLIWNFQITRIIKIFTFLFLCRFATHVMRSYGIQTIFSILIFALYGFYYFLNKLKNNSNLLDNVFKFF